MTAPYDPNLYQQFQQPQPPQQFQQYAPPQQFVQPQPPQQFQQYAPPQQFQQYGQPQQGYGQQPQQQAPALASGSISAFLDAPSVGGGQALKFRSEKNPGAPLSYRCVVTRDVMDGDVQQQTTPGTNMPAFYRDGRPKWVMKVPVMIAPTTEFPDGLAQWFIQGAAREEMMRSIQEAGSTAQAPQKGMVFDIEKTGTRPSGPGLNPSATWRVKCYLPEGTSAPAPQQVFHDPAPAQQQAPQPQDQQAYQQPFAQAPGPAPVAMQQQYQQPPAQSAQIAQGLQQAAGTYAQPAQQMMQAPPPQQMQQQMAPPAPQQGLAPPPNLDPAQQALYARLAGG